jgi:HAD superfamily hydrolase (TIGR01484 family)
MRYFALATDYDGTLAHDGMVDEPTLTALKRLRESGRKLIMVTGRQLPDLMDTFGHANLFDYIVAENGALLYQPSSRREKVLAEPACQPFVEALKARQVEPLAVGRVIVATWYSQKEKVLDAIQEQSVECQMIFNKGALMVLPSGVNKATGLKCALEEMGLSCHNIAGIGDAENDHAFLSSCEAAVAVANALPALKNRADWVTEGARGEGVQELIDALVADDLSSIAERLTRHDLLLGSAYGREVKLPAYNAAVMVAGTSGGGKSTLTTGFLERLHEYNYQFCAIDPEGDYQTFPGAIVLGDVKRPATAPEIMAVLEQPGQSVIVNLLGVKIEQRLEFFQTLLPLMMDLRARKGRPHWIIIDEAHHILPASHVGGEDLPLPNELRGFMLITLQPDHVNPTVVRRLEAVVVVGESPGDIIEKFASVCNESVSRIDLEELAKGKAFIWSRRRGRDPLLFDVAPSSLVSTRHSRKYATAELSPDRSFYFRGPEGKLKLRAQNLYIFLQLMDGVDDETWLYHFRKGEYSRWLRNNIKSDELADAVQEIESNEMPAAQSRRQIREQIEQRYTLPQ